MEHCVSDHKQNIHIRDWRWILVLVVVSYATLIAAAGVLGGKGAARCLLQVMGVPALEHPFMDIRGVAGWCEASARGQNPAIEATYITFPGEKPVRDFKMNYSPLVLSLGYLGLDQMHIGVWALFLGLLYTASLWFLSGPLTLTQAGVWALLILSPASVLVVERGNLDILLFALIVIALILRKHPFAESNAILTAGLIKFFPIGALSAVWREGGKRNRAAVMLGAILFLAFLILLRSRLGIIGGSLTGQYQSSFGSGVMADLFRHYGIIGEGKYDSIRRALTVLGIALLSLACSFGFLNWKMREQGALSGRMQHAFFLTGPFMLGLFVLGNQMDYKWIFFLPMVPAIFELIESSDAVDAQISKIWMGGILVYSYWTFFSDERSLRNALLKQVVMWGVMIVTAFLAGRLWKREVQ